MNLSQPVSWEDLILFANNPGLINVDMRSDEYRKKYAEYMTYSLEERSRIMIDELNFSHGVRYALIDNKFPYNVEKGIRHMVLFVNPNIVEDQDTIDRIVTNFAKENEYSKILIFKNVLSKQSIPTIPHYQVFFKI